MEEDSNATYDPSNVESMDSSMSPEGASTTTENSGQWSICAAETPDIPAQEVKSSRRARVPTQRYDDPIPTDVKNLFLCTTERNEIYEISEVTNEEKQLNPDMIYNSCKNELQGWHDFRVIKEVNNGQMINANCDPLLTRWNHIWKKDSFGTKAIKSRLVIKWF